MSADRERWGTRFGVILAVAGSAVGLGNFLRFPGQAAQHGGGAFLIPYFVALLLLGIPIGWAEWTMGRYGGKKGFHSGPGILGVVGRGSIPRYLGALGVAISLVVSFYYLFVEAWTLGYFFKYVTGGVGVEISAQVADQTAASARFFGEVSGGGADGSLFTGASRLTLACWAVTFLLNIYFLRRGISKGIEKLCTWAMPIMTICAIIVLIRVLTLGTPDPSMPERNVVSGLGFMWNPDFSKLGDFSTWLAAAGQIFFTLSVGIGVVLNYASYMGPKDDVVLSSLTATAVNESSEVGFGGMITLTASVVFLGVSGTIGAVESGSFGLGFVTLPVVFAHMGAWGNVIGAIWFFMLFLAALMSSLSMFQPTLAFLREALGMPHQRATALITALAIGGSVFTLWFTRNGTFTGTLDFWVGTFFLFVMAMIQIVVFSWVFGIERGWREAHDGASICIPGLFKFVMKWVAPIYLLVVFVGFCVQSLPAAIGDLRRSPSGQLAMAIILLAIVAMAVLVRRGERRWRAAGMDLDDRTPTDGDPAP
ncbi:MAG: sodium:calcium symporter [Gemmatimonadales bacterium]|nr:sodium:calcium symporter [Gemmatimonadales bacterium]